MADYLAAEEPRDGNGAKDHIMPSKVIYYNDARFG